MPMAAPEFVPVRPGLREAAYESPPRRLGSWLAARPAEIVDDGEQPTGGPRGYPGPDQGYALLLANRFRGELALTAGEHEDDAIAGCVAVALKRASLFGRAPVVFDLRMAFELWGFTAGDAGADPDLVTYRRPLFAEVSNSHHYTELRALATSVPEATLRLLPADLTARRADWRALLGA
jgi:hypothetical protein